MSENAPLEAVIVGAGHRAFHYAAHALDHPDELRIVGVVDPDESRRDEAASRFGIPPEACFPSVDDLLAGPPLGRVVINGTMDALHVPTTLPLLRAGYDVLLEKPFATHSEEMEELVRTTRETGRTVMICHVLRYAPFYAEIHRRVREGAIGEILNLQFAEHVSYHHMATGFIRGKWNNREACGSPMLLAKCCHDLDLMTWMKTGISPVTVASSGGLMHFRPEKAPEGAGKRCLVDCAIEETCSYSARKLYLDHPQRWRFYVWHNLPDDASPEAMEESLKTDNPQGRCVWHCDNDVVDHQSVVVSFADGATATLNLMGGAARASRTIHLLGSQGEIEGKFEDARFVIRRNDPRPGKEYSEEVVDLNVTEDTQGARGGHGGGDMRLIADFVRLVRGEAPSPSCTRLEDSVNSHRIAFAADRAMAQTETVKLVSTP